MSEDEHSPLLKRTPRKPTEAEVLAWRELSRDPGLPWDRLPDPRPYVRLAPRGIGLEVGISGTF